MQVSLSKLGKFTVNNVISWLYKSNYIIVFDGIEKKIESWRFD